VEGGGGSSVLVPIRHPTRISPLGFTPPYGSAVAALRQGLVGHRDPGLNPGLPAVPFRLCGGRFRRGLGWREEQSEGVEDRGRSWFLECGGEGVVVVGSGVLGGGRRSAGETRRHGAPSAGKINFGGGKRDVWSSLQRD
jgi:hypothetical protein